MLRWRQFESLPKEFDLTTFRIIARILLMLAGLALLPLNAWAQAVITPDSAATLEMLESRVQEIAASKDPEEITLLEFYRKSISLIERRRSYEVATQKFIKARELIPQQSARLREELAKLEAMAQPGLPDSLSGKALPELEQRLLSEKADVSGLTGTLAGLETSLETQTQRPQQARERLNEGGKDQTEIQDNLKSLTTEGQSPRQVEARRWALDFELRALNAEMEMLNQELLSQPMRIELLGAQRDKATLELSRKLNFVALLETLVTERRLSDAVSAKEAADETERQSFGKHELVQEIARKNTELGNELNSLAAALENITAEENEAAVKAKRVGANFRLTRQKLEITGLGEALGEMLLEQRRELPDSTDFEAAEQRRQRLVIESSLRQIRNQQERARLRDINVYVDELMVNLTETWKSLLRDEVLALAELRRDLLDKAIAADDTYLQALGELDFTRRQLSETVTDYNSYLSERLLWIRTGKRPSWQTLSSISENIGVFVSPTHWLQIGQALAQPDSFPWILLTGVVFFVLLTISTKALRASLKRSSSNVGQLRHDRIYYSFKALVLTLVLALPWPVLFAALGLQLQFVQANEAFELGSRAHQTFIWTGQFVPAIGAAFSGIALYAFYFIAFRVFCEPDGLAVAHFDWSLSTTEQLRYQTHRLMVFFLPTAFLLIASISYDPAALAGGLSRLFFVIVMTALTWFFGQILGPRQGVLREFYAANPGNPLTWLRYFWMLLGLAVPVMLAVLAVEGYVYTAAQLGQRLIDTLWLVVAIILIHDLVVRWLLVTQRSLAFRDALERRRQQRAAREATQEEGIAEEMEAMLLDEPEIDFQALGADTTKLINAVLLLVAAFGLWLIWSEVFPAFHFLEEFSLWSRTVVVDGQPQLVPVTLNDLILGMLAILMVVIAAQRLPALLEIVLLMRLNISAGSRYAISSLTQYSIVAAGVVLVFNLLGGNWSEIQWLIAALGVGIGFGLQEIVANFICGLILLFERPIRIGDIVTVGDTDGTVTKIRIRSTTIRNWDQKELLVPNKEFITGRLLNWTLTDPITRIVVPVGIAYGSDVELAIRLVREAADENERVLDEPSYLVTFDSFDDNAMTIVLRCFISSMDYWRQTTSELHLAINQKFKEAGIVIAFPQRDVHLNATEPLDVRIHPLASES
jgi:potassium efflux system protein